MKRPTRKQYIDAAWEHYQFHSFIRIAAKPRVRFDPKGAWIQAEVFVEIDEVDQPKKGRGNHGTKHHK